MHGPVIEGVVVRSSSAPNGDALGTLLLLSGRLVRVRSRQGARHGGVRALPVLTHVSGLLGPARSWRDLTEVQVQGALNFSALERLCAGQVVAALAALLCDEADGGDPLRHSQHDERGAQLVFGALRAAAISERPLHVTLLYIWKLLRWAGFGPRAAQGGADYAAQLRRDVASGVSVRRLLEREPSGAELRAAWLDVERHVAAQLEPLRAFEVVRSCFGYAAQHETLVVG